MHSEKERRWPGVTLARPGGSEVTRPWAPHRGETIDESYETERYLPVSEHEAALTAKDHDLAECYRLTGSDPDGDSDHHLAQHAVQAVRELREENERVGEWEDRAIKAEAALAKARAEALDEVREALEPIVDYDDWASVELALDSLAKEGS